MIEMSTPSPPPFDIVPNELQMMIDFSTELHGTNQVVDLLVELTMSALLEMYFCLISFSM